MEEAQDEREQPRDEYIQRCFRHQHPEAYGRSPVLTPRNTPYPVASSEERYQGSRMRDLGPMEQGRPDAVQLPREQSSELQAELERLCEPLEVPNQLSTHPPDTPNEEITR